MGLRAVVDGAVPSYSDRGQILSTGEVAEVLVANRLDSPTPLVDVEAWADLCGIEHIFGVDPERLNDYVERRVLITPEMTTSPDAKGTSPFTARVFIVWSESKAKLDREWRATYMKRVEERLQDIGKMKLNRRRYEDRDYAQSQVDKIFEGPTGYLKAVYGHPRVVEVHDGPDGQAALELEYGVDKEELRKLERRDGVYPVVTNLADSEEYPLKQIFERTRRKYQVERPMNPGSGCGRYSCTKRNG